MDLANVHIENVYLHFFYLAVNELVTDKTQKPFSNSIDKHSGFIKYSLSKQD